MNVMPILATMTCWDSMSWLGLAEDSGSSYLERVELGLSLLEISCYRVHRRSRELGQQNETCSAVVVPYGSPAGDVCR